MLLLKLPIDILEQICLYCGDIDTRRNFEKACGLPHIAFPLKITEQGLTIFKPRIRVLDRAYHTTVRIDISNAGKKYFIDVLQTSGKMPQNRFIVMFNGYLACRYLYELNLQTNEWVKKNIDNVENVTISSKVLTCIQ